MTMPQDTDNLEMAATATVTAAAAAAGDHSPVLRCGLCNKPFAKRMSTKQKHLHKGTLHKETLYR